MQIQAARPQSLCFRSSQCLGSFPPQAPIGSRQIKSVLNVSSLSKPYAPRVTRKALYGLPLPPSATRRHTTPPLPCAPVTWPLMPFSILGASALLPPSVMMPFPSSARCDRPLPPLVFQLHGPLWTTPPRSACVSFSPARPPQSFSNSQFCSGGPPCVCSSRDVLSRMCVPTPALPSLTTRLWAKRPWFSTSRIFLPGVSPLLLTQNTSDTSDHHTCGGVAPTPSKSL